jgi:excisionase family DNA binding protein
MEKTSTPHNNTKEQTSSKSHRPSPLTTPEAAEYLGLKPGTLEIWRCNGKGPNFLKLGRACRYRLEDLEEFMDKATRTSTSCVEREA